MDLDESLMGSPDVTNATTIKEKYAKKEPVKLKVKGVKAPPGNVKAAKGASARIGDSSVKVERYCFGLSVFTLIILCSHLN